MQHLLYTLIYIYIYTYSHNYFPFHFLYLSFISTHEFYFFNCLPHPSGKQGSEWTTVWCSATASLNHNTCKLIASFKDIFLKTNKKKKKKLLNIFDPLCPHYVNPRLISCKWSRALTNSAEVKSWGATDFPPPELCSGHRKAKVGRKLLQYSKDSSSPKNYHWKPILSSVKSGWDGSTPRSPSTGMLSVHNSSVPHKRLVTIPKLPTGLMLALDLAKKAAWLQHQHPQWSQDFQVHLLSIIASINPSPLFSESLSSLS